MTTIVADRKVGFLAADRMQTTNDCEVAIECSKIRQIPLEGGIYLVACAGDEGPIEWFYDWFAYDDDPLSKEYDQPDALELGEDESLTAVILTPRSEILVCDHWMRPYPVTARYYAAGTGGPIARAILRAGCGVDKAMTVAIEDDPNSGFGYDVEYINDVNGD